MPLAVAGVVLMAALLSAAPATAQGQGTGLFVTIAARSCPSYQAVRANLARNDVQESLQNLGGDSPYQAGTPIDPDLEATTQPLCSPLPNWRFTLGRGYATKAVTGPWGALSIVTRPFGTEIVTQPSVPLLDSNAAAIPSRTLAGATTIELTRTQADLASGHNLWIQGGTTTDPVLNETYPGAYGFAALRCAIDNLNGDNVEWIAFPTGAEHVFCFAYYVQPPPTSGTIIVRKEVAGSQEVARHTFHFDGDLSYNPGGLFDETAAPGDPGSATFFRAAGATPWTVRELVEPGWRLLDLTCTSAGASTATTDVATATAQVRLAAGDTVTCTFRNGLAPPPSGLTLGKVTIGATGSTVFDVSGPGVDDEGTVTTTEERRAAYEELAPVASGDYEVRERPVPQAGGRWERRLVRCDGRIVPDATGPLDITVPEGQGLVCVFINEFVHTGSIRVRKITTGGTGTVGFTIRPVGDPEQVYQQFAVSSRQGVPVTATGDDTDALPIGTYDIQETDPGGHHIWQLESVVCNGRPVGSAQGRIRVRLTDEEPDLTCTFTDRRTREDPTDDEPGRGGEGGQGEQPADPTPITNLRIVKRVRPTRIILGRPARYTVVVRNTSDVIARDVVITELQPPSHRRVNVEAPSGARCRGTRPLRCSIGDLAPGESVRLHATYTTRLRGRVVNRVAVHTSTRETRLGDNRAAATLRVGDGRPSVCAARARC